MIDNIKIMQYADGTLPLEEQEEVKKAIETNPEFKKLFKDYQETGDLLFKLGNEIKSQPLPDSLQEKFKIIKSWKKAPKETGMSFNFFRLFKMQYAAIAAALVLFFYGGFYTSEILMVKKIKNSPNLLALGEKDNKFVILKSKSDEMSKENLSERITDFYRYFDEIKFTNEINAIIDNIEENEEFELSFKDVNGKKVKFVLKKTYSLEDETQCKEITFKEKVALNPNRKTNINLSLCKKGDKYKLVSINLLR
jgi:hypothetical protein|tara:strand:- start:1105 stop:1860 length:756 start_codon:yes stop_codon:yes gene_type:complete